MLREFLLVKLYHDTSVFERKFSPMRIIPRMLRNDSRMHKFRSAGHEAEILGAAVRST